MLNGNGDKARGVLKNGNCQTFVDYEIQIKNEEEFVVPVMSVSVLNI